MLIDSHAHLSCETLRESLDQILPAAKAAGIDRVFNICTNPEELAHGLALCQQYPWVYNVGSTTPHDVEKEGESAFGAFAQAAREKKLVAVGETGLDYFYEHAPKKSQQEFLRRYLRLALECNLPVVIHCRDAFEDLFTILDEEYRIDGKWAPGLLHCFTGTQEEAQRLVSEGWLISFSGIVTFKKSEVLRQVAASVPLANILIETDAPYLAPQSKRGKTNEPAYLVETAHCMAKIHGCAFEELAKQTSKNANHFFNTPRVKTL